MTPSTPAPAPTRDVIETAASRLAVFMANRNHGCFLAAALDALLAQSVRPREIRIVDDASTDESRDIIARCAARHAVIRPVLLPEARGVVTNMAAFLEDVDTEFVYFAASADVVMPGFLEESLAMLVRHPEAGLCSAMSRLMDKDGRDRGTFRSLVPPTVNGFIPPALAASALLRYDGWIMGNTTVYRRAMLRSAGGFNPALEGFADGYACRVIALAHGTCFILKDLAYWRRLATGYSAATNTEPDRVRRVADEALACMTTTHAGEFSAAYPARWLRRWIYGAVTQCLRIEGAEAWSRILAILAPATAADRLAVSLCRGAGRAGRLLFLLYTVLSLRRGDLFHAGLRNIFSFIVRRRRK